MGLLTSTIGSFPKPAELREISERWRPYRSVASWYLWRATELVTMD